MSPASSPSPRNPLQGLAAQLRALVSRPALQSASQPLLGAIDEGMRAKLAGDYDAALAAFEQGEREVESFGVKPMMVLPLRVQRVETLIFAHRLDDAEHLLDETAQTELPDTAYGAQYAVFLNILRGQLAGARGADDAARNFFETARADAKRAADLPPEARAACHIAELAYADGNARYALHLLTQYLPALSTISINAEWMPHFLGIMALAEIEVGQETEGHQHLARALSAAEEAGDVRHVRRWSLEMAERAISEARFHDAETHLQRVIAPPIQPPVSPIPPPAAHPSAPPDSEAVSPTPPPAPETLAQPDRSPDLARDLARAHTLLSRVYAFQGEWPRAEENARAALALDLADNRRLQRTAQIALGMALRGLNRAQEAIEPLRDALGDMLRASAGDARVSPSPGSGTTVLAAEDYDALRVFAVTLVDTRAYDEAIALYERAGASADKAGARLAYARIRRDLSLAYQAMGRNADALTTGSAALVRLEEQNAYAEAARLACDIAQLRRASGQAARARRDIENALVLLNKVDGYDMDTRGRVLSNAALIYAESGDAESADSFFSEAILLAQRSEDPFAESVRAGNYAYFRLTVGRPRQAIANLERALQISRSRPAMRLHTAVQTDNLGLAYDQLAEYATALEHHLSAMEMVSATDESATGEWSYWRAIFQIHAGMTRLSMGELAAARHDFEAAFAWATAHPDQTAAREVSVRARIGQGIAALRAGESQQAADILAQTVADARALESRRWLADALSAYSQAVAQFGRGDEVAALWGEAAKLYTVLHMPQGKLKPAWLAQEVSEQP